MSGANIVFDHVHLISRDPESAAQWYVDNLGGEIAFSGDVRGAPQVIVAFEGATVIIRAERPGEQAGLGIEGLQWGTDHFGFSIKENFNEFCDELKQKGVKFTMEPVDFAPTVRIAFIEAPDEVSIELLIRK